MIATRFSFLLALLAGALLAGCGSSGSNSTSTSTPASTTTASASTVSTSATQTTSTTASTPSSSVPSSAAGVAEAVAACKSIVQREPTLSSSVKSKVEGICNKAANGDLEGAKAAAKEVCKEVINAAPIPSSAKAQGIAACERSS